MNKYCQNICKYKQLCYLYMTHQKIESKKVERKRLEKYIP